MSYSHTAISTDLDEDLRVFSAFLQQQGIPHQISEQSGVQVLLLDSEQFLDVVQEYYRDWKSDRLDLKVVKRSDPAAKGLGGTSELLKIAATSPLTLLMILGCFAGFALYMKDPKLSLLSHFTFVDFQLFGGRLQFSSAERDLWRYITPIFLHFGWLHVVFNSLWLWEIGGRIERSLGALMLLGLVLVSGVISNAAQFWVTGPSLFGGMSGVVYALLGFCWVAGWLQPNWGISIPGPMVVLMIGWLLVCMSGLIEVLGFGTIANGAHLGGLSVGCGLGLLFGLFGTARFR